MTPLRTLALLLAAGAVATAAAPSAREAAFQTRVRQVINSYARVNTADPAAGSYATIAAKLRLRQDPAWCSRRLEALLVEPTGDMFWMFPVTAVAYLDGGQLTPAARDALRRAWRTYMPFRGDTENHWLLYYTSLYLMAQKWPHEPGSAWFTGKTSEENFREAESYLLHWIDLTTTRGQGEYDCTHYIGVYLLPLSYLAAWSEDPVMRKRAAMMLDYVIADYAAENLDGLYGGAHARTDDVQVLEKWNGVSSDFGWLLFGLGRPLPGYSYYGLFYTIASAYWPPEVIHRIATDRSRDYLHYELKRTRHRWRFTDVRNGLVYKTTYMRRDYVAGSDQGGVLQPIQQHSWDVTWTVPDPRGVHNTIFAIHPYSSPAELQTYFTPMPDALTESVVRSKRSYDSPDKFLGGSPYERVFQDLDTIIALYDIPPGTRFPHINGFFSKDLRDLREDSSGWIFARGGNAWLAYRPLAPYEWRPMPAGDRRLYSPHLHNGAIVQAAAASEFPNLEAFARAVVALPLDFRLTPTPSVRFRSLRGHDLAFTWGQAPTVDGKPLDYNAWKLFSGPFLNSERGSRKLVLTHGALRRTLDFAALTVTDEEMR